MFERAMSLCHVLLGNACTNPIAEDVSSQLVCVTKTIQQFIQTALADGHHDQLKANGKWTYGPYFLNAYIHTQVIDQDASSKRVVVTTTLQPFIQMALADCRHSRHTGTWTDGECHLIFR